MVFQNLLNSSGADNIKLGKNCKIGRWLGQPFNIKSLVRPFYEQ